MDNILNFVFFKLINDDEKIILDDTKNEYDARDVIRSIMNRS